MNMNILIWTLYCPFDLLMTFNGFINLPPCSGFYILLVTCLQWWSWGLSKFNFLCFVKKFLFSSITFLHFLFLHLVLSLMHSFALFPFHFVFCPLACLSIYEFSFSFSLFFCSVFLLYPLFSFMTGLLWIFSVLEMQFLQYLTSSFLIRKGHFILLLK